MRLILREQKGICNQGNYTMKCWDSKTRHTKCQAGSLRDLGMDDYLRSLHFRFFLHHHPLGQRMTVLVATSCVWKGGWEEWGITGRLIPVSCVSISYSGCDHGFQDLCYFWWCLTPGTMGRLDRQQFFHLTGSFVISNFCQLHCVTSNCA